MNPIKILGGGIAGLTAAINLKKAGRDVEVHERKTFCGKPSSDFESLENWTFNEDSLEFLKRINIKSGYFAAKCIIKRRDYDKLWRENIHKPMKISTRNRFLYKRLSKAGYENILNLLASNNPVIKKLRRGADFRLILKKLYNTSVFFLFPFLFRFSR
jgi:flavin-dependent dehydrogenase